MVTKFSYLETNDIPGFIRFVSICRSDLTKFLDWALLTLAKDPENMVIAVEWEDDHIVGFSCSCALKTIVGLSHPFLPIYVNVRMERLPGNRVNSFSTFIDKTSCMISSFFERKNFFQYYSIRRLPKNKTSLSDIGRVCDTTWKSHPYFTVVDYIVKNEDDYNNLPQFFKKINGPYISPFVILTGILPNEFRDMRKLVK